MNKIAVLGSTNGIDLIPIVKAINCNYLHAEIAFVLSNRKNSGILEKARKYGIKDIYLSSKGMSREDYDQKIRGYLAAEKIKLVILIGYMRFLSEDFVNFWGTRTMNIHPSLLPAFEGKMDMDIHTQVLKRGCKLTGATLMFIDQGADTGPIISQRVVPVLQGDTPETLKERVQEAEGQLLVQGIHDYFDNRFFVNPNDSIVVFRW